MLLNLKLSKLLIYIQDQKLLSFNHFHFDEEFTHQGLMIGLLTIELVEFIIQLLRDVFFLQKSITFSFKNLIDILKLIQIRFHRFQFF